MKKQQRRVWHDGNPELGNKLMKLARSFPLMARQEERWAPDGKWDPDAMLLYLDMGISTSERATAEFLMFVFNNENPFDFRRAILKWDNESCAVFAAWAKDPWWA